MVGVLPYFFAVRDTPQHIRSDNGPELVATVIRDWLRRSDVRQLFIATGSPSLNGYVESIHGKLRDELLDRELFLSMEEARWVIERWQLDDNQRRIHSTLDDQTPAAHVILSLVLDQSPRVVSTPNTHHRRLNLGMQSCALLMLILALAIFGHGETLVAKEVFFQSGSTQLKGHLAMPNGTGPFPAVIYLHGGRGAVVGGNPKETAEALAKAGLVGFSPSRRKNTSIAGNVQDVIAYIDFVEELKDVDDGRLALLGVSRVLLWAIMA